MNSIWHNRGLRNLIMLLPFILMIVVPLAYYAIITIIPKDLSGNGISAELLSVLGEDAASLEYTQLWFLLFTTLICPLLFLLIPVVISAATASYILLLEKREGTLETLFLSSMEARSVFNSKVSFCVLLSLFVSLVSFIALFITVSVIDVMLGAPLFLNLEWLITVLLLMPALSFFSVVFISFNMNKVNDVSESVQTVGYILLPLTLMFAAQLTGFFDVSVWVLLLLTLLIVVGGIILFNVSSRRFSAESVLASAANDGYKD